MTLEIIQHPDSTFQELMDFKRDMRDENYHPSSFVISKEVPEGLLLFHTLTCEMVLARKGQKDMSKDEYLREHLFVVPESLDEKKLAEQYRALRKMVDAGDEEDITSSYTIMTTTDCNARCFYCYEKGRSRIPMSEKTAMKVASLIQRNYSKQPKKDVSLRWFGGEPLYNGKVIDLICNQLEKSGVPFKSSMTSNSYLFDEATVQKAVNLWKLQKVQITLDGTEAIYNRSKAFIYDGSASPYRRVVRNIGLLLDAGIRVIVRLNIGLHNADDLVALVRQLSNMYGKRKGFCCYAHVLFEESAGSGNVRQTDESRRLVYEKLEQLESLMADLGIRGKDATLPKEVRQNWCMADNGKSLMIAPTGDIGLCEHYSEDHFISHVDSPDVVDKAMVAKFRQRRERIELCDNCPIYPQCIRLKMCEESATCTPEKVENQVNQIKFAMMRTYEKYRRGK
ncbi:MAG: 4Fe-4S cluster-binding domain-containing protein [Bacteroidales bacterium]|nr:4Fe-4S cluster-binding domain-containing protein [Bacteroidales bacterium]